MSHHVRRTALALAALLLLTLCAVPHVLQAQDVTPATVSVETPASVPPGTTDIPLNVNVKGASNLAAFQFVLSFDSSMLQYVSVDKTDFLGKTGREVQCADPTVDTAAVRFTCVTLRLQPNGVDGDGTIAVVHLKSISGGKSPVQLSTVKLVHPDGSELPSTTVNGSLTISSGGGTSFPRWALVVGGVAVVAVLLAVALLWRRRGTTGGGGDASPYGSAEAALRQD